MSFKSIELILLLSLFLLFEISIQQSSLNEECPTECPNELNETRQKNYSPICSSNGTVFESVCQMMMLSNCSLTISDWENCRGLHPLCPADCLDIQDPVCGDDNKLYPNKCVMHKRNCGKVIQERPVIFCFGSHRKSRKDQCPESCMELYKPVCGSDGQIYLNECYLKMQNCDNGVEKVDMNECAQSNKCPSYCIPIYDPVCGSDGKVYLNQCMMLRDNCDNNKNNSPPRPPTINENGTTIAPTDSTTSTPIKSMPLQFCVGEDDVDKV